MRGHPEQPSGEFPLQEDITRPRADSAEDIPGEPTISSPSEASVELPFAPSLGRAEYNAPSGYWMPVTIPQSRPKVSTAGQGSIYQSILLTVLNSVSSDVSLSGLEYSVRPTPLNHEEAMSSEYAEEWRAAELAERQSLIDNDVLGELVRIPPGIKPLTCKFIYKWKPPMPEEQSKTSRKRPQAGPSRRRVPRAKVRLTARDFH